MFIDQFGFHIAQQKPEKVLFYFYICVYLTPEIKKIKNTIAINLDVQATYRSERIKHMGAMWEYQNGMWDCVFRNKSSGMGPGYTSPTSPHSL